MVPRLRLSTGHQRPSSAATPWLFRIRRFRELPLRRGRPPAQQSEAFWYLAQQQYDNCKVIIPQCIANRGVFLDHTSFKVFVSCATQLIPSQHVLSLILLILRPHSSDWCLPTCVKVHVCTHTSLVVFYKKDGVSSRISFRCVCRAHHSFLHVFDPSLVKPGDSNMTDPVFALDAIVRLSPQYLHARLPRNGHPSLGLNGRPETETVTISILSTSRWNMLNIVRSEKERKRLNLRNTC